jgi:hypothetical protein
LWASIACVLILMFAPLVISVLRTWSISLRYPDLDAQVTAVERVEKQQVMYTELNKRAWPMTKLLADITANTPVGIELESVRITNDNETFAVNGQARPEAGQSATDLVAKMQANLRGTGIFTEIGLNWGKSDSYGNFEFDLSGHVERPTRRFRYDMERDFANWTLEARVNNDPPPGGDDEPATEPAGLAVVDEEAPTQTPPPPVTTETIVANADDSETDPAASPPRGNGRVRTPTDHSSSGAEGARRSETGQRGPGGIAPSQELPQFLTAEEIQALNKPDLIEQLKVVASARKNYRGDEETTTKIEEQWGMLRARLSEILPIGSTTSRCASKG